jgi:hypothetical protein
MIRGVFLTRDARRAGNGKTGCLDERAGAQGQKIYIKYLVAVLLV